MTIFYCAVTMHWIGGVYSHPHFIDEETDLRIIK